jgi:hypothetical protein
MRCSTVVALEGLAINHFHMLDVVGYGSSYRFAWSLPRTCLGVSNPPHGGDAPSDNLFHSQLLSSKGTVASSYGILRNAPQQEPSTTPVIPLLPRFIFSRGELG